ncbi:hypothetical protein GCM10022221_13600 [Actinocorallia aurea]
MQLLGDLLEKGISWVSMLESGPEGAVVILPRDIPVATILGSPAVLDALEGGAPGIVVIDEDGRVVGAVPVARLRAAAAALLDEPRRLVSDAHTYGDAGRLPPVLRLPCGACGEVKEFEQFSRLESYTCVNGHAFVLSREGR